MSGDLIAKIEKADRRAAPDVLARLDEVLEADGDLIRLAAEREDVARQQALATESSTRRAELSDEELLATLTEMLDGVRRMDHGLGSGHVAPSLAAHSRLAIALLPTFGASGRRSALRLLGEIHQLSGWIRFDQGDAASAEETFVAARTYAESAGDYALAAYVVGPSHGFALTYTGNPSAGARRAAQAIGFARRSGNRKVLAFVLAVGARAQAKIGDKHTCLSLLDEAHRELDRHEPDPSEPAWLDVFDHAALRGHRGSCWLDLGDADRAVRSLVEEHSSAPELFVRNRAIWLVDRAKAHAALSEIEQACLVLGQALGVARGTTSRRTSSHLHAAVGLVRRWHGLGEVTALEERFRVEIHQHDKLARRDQRPAP